MSGADSSRPVAIVTGATTPFGAAALETLLSLGYAVVAQAPPGAGAALSLRVRELVRDGGRAVAWKEALGPESVEALLARATGAFGPPRCVVICSSLDRARALSRISASEVRRSMESVMEGTFALCQAAAEVMKPAGGGRLVCVTSRAGVGAPGFGQSHHALVAGGVRAFVRAAAPELRSIRVAINAVATSMIDLPGPPDGRVGPVDTAAEAIVGFLASTDHNLTGQVITVEGRKLSLLRPTASVGALTSGEQWTARELKEKWASISR